MSLGSLSPNITPVTSDNDGSSTTVITYNGGTNQTNLDHSAQASKYIVKAPGDITYSAVGPEAANLPKSLFYEHTEDSNGAPNGLFNYYLIGKGAADVNGKPFSYKGSERYGNSSQISSMVSRNPTAGNIVSTTTTSGAYLDPHSDFCGQPYNPKDFLFCKYYGAIPNNRMITLRRFPNPVFDNLKVPVASVMPGLDPTGKKVVDVATKGVSAQQLAKTQMNTPVAQAITYFGEGTGNELNNMIGFFTGMNWKTQTQKDRLDLTDSDQGMFTDFNDILGGILNKDASDFLQGASNLGGTFLNQSTTEARWGRALYDRLTDKSPGSAGPWSERIFVDINTVDKMLTRDRGLSGGFNEMNIVFKYDLTSASDINSKLLFLDLLGNLLSIGTDYGKFSTPQILENPRTMGLAFPGGTNSYLDFKFDPVGWIIDAVSKNVSAEAVSKLQKVTDLQNQIKELGVNIRQHKPIDKDSEAYQGLTLLLSQNLISSLVFTPMMLSGYPTGDWHLVVGNPLNPIAMIGNLVCKGVDIKFNSELGPDDFPTEMTATYTLQHARQRHRGEFESMFNRGNGRLYLGELPATVQAQNTFVNPTNGSGNQGSTANLKSAAQNASTNLGGSAPANNINQ